MLSKHQKPTIAFSGAIFSKKIAFGWKTKQWFVQGPATSGGCIIINSNFAKQGPSLRRTSYFKSIYFERIQRKRFKDDDAGANAQGLNGFNYVT